MSSSCPKTPAGCLLSVSLGLNTPLRVNKEKQKQNKTKKNKQTKKRTTNRTEEIKKEIK